MRNEFVTPFWKDALASLPKEVQAAELFAACAAGAQLE
jgi:hypothetical protein